MVDRGAHIQAFTFSSQDHGRMSIKIPGKRPHVLNMRAFSGYTWRLPERTHGGVLNLHTEGFPPSLFFLLSPLLFFSSSLLFSSLVISSLPSLVFSLLSATMTMITRPVGLSFVYIRL